MQSEKNTKTRRKYDRTGAPDDFKTEVLRMWASGQTPAYIANKFLTGPPERHIECYYNRGRKHSSLGYKSPEQFENEYLTKLANLVCR